MKARTMTHGWLLVLMVAGWTGCKDGEQSSSTSSTKGVPEEWTQEMERQRESIMTKVQEAVKEEIKGIHLESSEALRQQASALKSEAGEALRQQADALKQQATLALEEQTAAAKQEMATLLEEQTKALREQTETLKQQLQDLRNLAAGRLAQATNAARQATGNFQELFNTAKERVEQKDYGQALLLLNRLSDQSLSAQESNEVTRLKQQTEQAITKEAASEAGENLRRFFDRDRRSTENQ